MIRIETPIETGPLVLRPFRQADLSELAEIHGRPEVVRFLYWDVRAQEEVRSVLASKIAQAVLQEEGRRLTLAVELSESSRLGGEVTLAWVSRQHRQGEIGFIVHPEFQGRGIATEAARVMLRLGFEELELHRIVGRCDARNLASARVMQRLGMRREAHLIQNEMVKGEWCDELVYAILQEEWAAGFAIPQEEWAPGEATSSSGDGTSRSGRRNRLDVPDSVVQHPQNAAELKHRRWPHSRRWPHPKRWPQPQAADLTPGAGLTPGGGPNPRPLTSPQAAEEPAD